LMFPFVSIFLGKRSLYFQSLPLMTNLYMNYCIFPLMIGKVCFRLHFSPSTLFISKEGFHPLNSPAMNIYEASLYRMVNSCSYSVGS
jgi:hypothetical protein